MKKRGTSVWQGGVWIGKDENDMHVLLKVDSSTPGPSEDVHIPGGQM